MPLPPLPPENTIRYYIDYSIASANHTFIIRANAVASPANIGTLVDAIFTQLANTHSAITLNTVRFSAAGSNVTNPVVSGFEGTLYGANSETEHSPITSLNFIGRASTGRRAKFEVFGYRLTTSNFRLTSVEDARVASVVSTINGALNSFFAIDGVKPVWYPYANVSLNAYWNKALRV